MVPISLLTKLIKPSSLARYDMEEGILQEMLVTRFIDLVMYNVPGVFVRKEILDSLRFVNEFKNLEETNDK